MDDKMRAESSHFLSIVDELLYWSILRVTRAVSNIGVYFRPENGLKPSNGKVIDLFRVNIEVAQKNPCYISITFLVLLSPLILASGKEDEQKAFPQKFPITGEPST